jgi:hypothetical protein
VRECEGDQRHPEEDEDHEDQAPCDEPQHRMPSHQ